MKRLILIALAAAMTLQGQAQGTREDYLNAFGTREKWSGKMLNGDVWVRPVHLAGADTMYYSTYNGTGTVWYSVNIHNGEKQQVENPDRNRQERRRRVTLPTRSAMSPSRLWQASTTDCTPSAASARSSFISRSVRGSSM